MKYITILLVFFSFSARSQGDETDFWTNYMTPNEVHAMLSEYAGNYSVEVKMDEFAENLTGTAEVLLETRLLSFKYTGTFSGNPYSEVMLIGYNNASGSLEMMSMNNFGTGMTIASGKMKRNERSCILRGTMASPTGEKPVAFKAVIEFGKNKITLDFYDESPEGETKTSAYVFQKS